MKKRFFAGLLLALMLIVSAVPAFAEPAEAPNEEPVLVQEEIAVVPDEEPEAEEKDVKNIYSIKETVYNDEAKTLSITLVNNTNSEQEFPFVFLSFDAEKLNIVPNNQYIFDLEYLASVAPMIGLDMAEINVDSGVAILLTAPIKANSESVLTIDAIIPEYSEENIPMVDAKLVLGISPTDINLSSQQMPAETSFNIQVFENIMAAPVETTPVAAVSNFAEQTGFSMLIRGIADNWKVLVMILISCILMYLAIAKKFEPLLLLPIAFGMLLTNLPGAGMFHEELFAGGHVHWGMFGGSGEITPGLLDYLYLGVKLGIYPCLIFVGVGAMTDFGPLIANPKSLLLGAAAQLGIFITFIVMYELVGFTDAEAASTGIIGGADGPTAIFVTSKLAPHLLGPIAVAAYSYMALVPVIQPPIMKALTSKKERSIVMKPLRTVSKTEKIVFPIIVTVFVSLLVPSAGPLVGCLMLGNLAKECGVVDRIAKTVQNELMNIVTIFLGLSVGATATANTFLEPTTLAIICVGIVAFGVGTAGGVLLAKFMNLFTKNKINPLMGSAGVSAVPMAARVSQTVGQKENPQNFLLMHAMGPNVAGVIGSAIAAGVLIALFG